MKKKNRVKNTQEFQSIIHNGQKLVNASFVFYYVTRKENNARIGISIPKKFGHAVDRNKAKRQVRMMCQDIIDFSTYENDGIFIIRFGYQNKDYATNKNNLEKIIQKSTMV